MVATLPMLKITRDQFNEFVAAVGKDYTVYGPTVKERFFDQTFYVFDRIADPADMVIHYTWTVFSPKKILVPDQKLFDYDVATFERTAELDTSPRIIFGVHNCDMNATGLIDWVYLQDNPDSYYAARRRNTLFVGVTCLPDRECFCRAVDWYEVKTGFDLYLHAVDGTMMLEAKSPKGAELLDGFAHGERATEQEVKALAAAEDAFEQETLHMNTPAPNLPMLFTASYESTVWEETAARCVSCGACHLVCPTCFCTHVGDTPNARLDGGSMLRQGDGCMLRSFAEIGSHENFRYGTHTRLKHRWYRKHKYLFERTGKSFCVGCGRCGRECPTAIKPVEIVNDLLERL